MITWLQFVPSETVAVQTPVLLPNARAPATKRRAKAQRPHDVVAFAAQSEVDDATLMLRYRDGDAAAFAQLYERHKAPLNRYLTRLCRRPEVADDLFQEVWSKLIATRDRYEVRAQFKTFLYRIAHNTAMDFFRRNSRQAALSTIDIDADEPRESLPCAEADGPESRFEQAQLGGALIRALETLPPEQRDAFLLYEEAGLTLAEIGSVTGVGLEAAKSRLRYAVGKLRAALELYAPESES